MISIHAPREGCDEIVCGGIVVFLTFQSTHPVRGATVSMPAKLMVFIFQSTHPVRGATGVRQQHDRDAHISIHAPREGCDGDDGQEQSAGGDISIHAPREGCDYLHYLLHCSIKSFQSTHPVRGATLSREYRKAITEDFNPRTP